MFRSIAVYPPPPHHDFVPLQRHEFVCIGRLIRIQAAFYQRLLVFFVCLFSNSALVMASISDVLQQAIACRGKGEILTILEGLIRTHATRIESTSHGLFVKCFYKKTSNGASFTRLPSPSSAEKLAYDWEVLLMVRPCKVCTPPCVPG